MSVEKEEYVNIDEIFSVILLFEVDGIGREWLNCACGRWRHGDWIDNYL